MRERGGRGRLHDAMNEKGGDVGKGGDGVDLRITGWREKKSKRYPKNNGRVCGLGLGRVLM